MWFRWKSRRVRELESELFHLEHQLFEAQEFERIASGKLTAWVRKHDDLLIAYKELKSKYEPINTTLSSTPSDERGG